MHRAKENDDREYVLLMTACISPSDELINNRYRFRGDPYVRLNDYKVALLYWLRYKDRRIVGIVFIENSKSDLSELRTLARDFNIYNRKIEFLQFSATKIPANMSYGYSELEMLDNAFDSSSLIRSYDHFIKVTGRLYFPSLSLLLNKISVGTYITVDSRDYKILKVKKQYSLTTLFITRKDFYREVIYGLRNKMFNEDNGITEILFYKTLKPLYVKNPNEVVIRFPVNVEPVGVGAHWNSNYGSAKKKTEAFVRGILRVICPSFWV